MLLTVLLPATNAPKPPMNGEKKGHEDPVSDATPSANTIGIFSYPPAPPAELINTCTIGTVKTRAIEALSIVRAERFQAAPKSLGLMPCKMKVSIETMIKIVPGR